MTVHAYIHLRILPNGRYQVRWIDRQRQPRRLLFATAGRAHAFTDGLAASRTRVQPAATRHPVTIR